MKPTVERLTEQFTQLIGPEAFAKANAAIAAAKVAAEAAAKAVAEKAAAAAKAAAEKAAAAAPLSGSTPPATIKPPSPATVAPATVRSAALAAPSNPPGDGARAPGIAATRSVAPVQPGSTPVAPPAPRAAGVTTATPPPRPAPTPAPAAAPIPTLPVQATPAAAKGYDFDAVVASTQVVLAAQILDGEGFGIDTITGVDWIAQNEMEVVYDFFHPTSPLRVVVRTRVPRANPELPTIVPIFPGANWHERETHDFFGIRFLGHPNLKPFLLPEDAHFHPLRKDYQP